MVKITTAVTMEHDYSSAMIQAHTTMSSSPFNPGKPVEVITSELKLTYNDHVDDPTVLITGIITGSNQKIEMLLTSEFYLNMIKFDHKAIFPESSSSFLNISTANNKYKLVKIMLNRGILSVHQDLPNLPSLHTHQIFPHLFLEFDSDLIRPREDNYALIQSIALKGFINIKAMLLQSFDENDATLPQYAYFSTEDCQTTDLNVEIEKMLFGSETNISKKDENGQSLLHSALNERGMYHRYLESFEPNIVDALKGIDRKFLHPTARCIETLVKLQVDINIVDCDTQTPIYLAVKHNDLESAEIILKENPNLNIRCYDGKMALHRAVLNRNLTMVEMLLGKNESMFILNSDQLGPLSFSYKRLVVPENDYPNEEKRPLMVVLNNGTYLNVEGRINRLLLIAAMKKDDLAAIKTLLKYNVNANFKNRKNESPLHDVIQLEEFGRRYSIELRLKYTKFLLEDGADVNAVSKIGETALHFAAKTSDALPLVEILLEHGAHVNLRSKYGRTPLHYACRIRNLKMIKMLLHYNADIKIRDNEGRTPLHFAVWGGSWSGIDDRKTQLQSIINLLKVKIDINDKDDKGRTPLHACCELNKFSIEYEHEFSDNHDLIASVLIKSGASINAVDMQGKTPIYYAIKNNFFGILEVLINNGADINILDKKNKSPLEKHFNNMHPDDDARLYSNALVHAFLEHVIKLNYAKMYVCKQNLDVVFNYDERNNKWIEEYQNFCAEELIRMKLENVPNSKTSFYDILVNKNHDYIYLVNNNDLILNLSSDEFINKFPIYGHILRCRFAEEQKRSSLVQRARVITKSNIFNKLPDLCIHEILRFLTTDELTMLVDITKSAVIELTE